MTNAADAFVREIDGDAEPSFFDEPTLNKVQEFGMFFVTNMLKFTSNSIAMFVDITDAVLPNFLFPFFSWTRILENSFVTIDRSHLSRFFFDGHLADQIGNAILDGKFRIFIRVLFAILVSIDPVFRSSRCAGVARFVLRKQKVAIRQNKQDKDATENSLIHI